MFSIEEHYRKKWRTLQYIKQKRNQKDHCNICGKITNLTWDHVPPKAVKIADGAYANVLFKDVMPSEEHHMKNYQNGVKYRTVCADCNNNLLGKYDKVYVDFINRINERLQNLTEDVMDERINSPIDNSISLNVQINKVLRSVLGHFLAMKNIYDTETTVDKYLREYLMSWNNIKWLIFFILYY